MLILFSLLATFTIFQTIDDFYLSDSLSTTMMFSEPYQLHSVFVMDYHTFLFKLPFFFAEERLGLTVTNHVILSLFFTTSMFACIGYVFFRLTKSYRYTALSLAGMLLMFFLIPQRYSLNNMTMPSMRNVEYGLFFLAFYWLYSSRSRALWIGALGIVTLLVASDPMFAPYAVGASALVGILVLHRRFTLDMKQAGLRALVVSIGAAILGDFTLRIASASGLVVVGKESGMKFTSGPVESVSQAFELFTDGLRSLLATFGIDIIKAPVHQPITILAIIFLVLLLVMIGLSLKRRLYRSPKLYGWRELYAVFSFSIVGVALVVYTLTNHIAAGENIRFFHIALFALFVLVAYSLSILKPLIHHWMIACFVVTFIAGSLTGIARAQRYAAFSEQHVAPTYHTIIDSLATQDIAIIAGDYWHIYPITARAEAVQSRTLQVYPLTQRCSSLQAYFVDRRWTEQPKDTKYFAVVASMRPIPATYDNTLPMSTGCTPEQALSQFGEPAQQFTINPVPDVDLYGYRILIYPVERLKSVDTTRFHAKLSESYQF